MALTYMNPCEDFSLIKARPLLKWAGGKTQLLNEIIPKIPSNYGRYIEPFFGGGALFFAVEPKNGIIADSNPELINLYQSVANNIDDVIKYLKLYVNDEKTFYQVRSQDRTSLTNEQAAARTIFLNKTCFNGLYRVNKSGNFNVPYGRYKNPKIVDEPALRAASKLLQNNKIVLGDYKAVLKKYAKPGDFIFLDPPYLPISEYSDFQRYTKEQFYEEDHTELSEEIMRLHNMGCHVILTNSNHPLVHEQYSQFLIEVIQTKRHISSNSKTRNGEDVIVTIPPKVRFDIKLVPDLLPAQLIKYPSTRYMGSKNKLLTNIWGAASQFKFDSVLDLFSGSGIVSYMFKTQGKSVTSNDYMAMSATFAKAMVENNKITLSNTEALALLENNVDNDKFIQKKFKGIYFSDADNKFLDTVRSNIINIKNPYKRAIAMSALIRACLKKRPRGIFTYIGEKYDDGRKDLTLSFKSQFLNAVEEINNSIFDNGKTNKAKHGDAMSIKSAKPDLVYIDPPYFSPLSDNEYVRRYHFVEGLARNWEGVEIQEHTITKKFKSYPTPFSSRKGAESAFDTLFNRYRKSVLIVSYSSNSQPTLDEMVNIMSRHKHHVEVIPIDHNYSFGTHSKKVGNNRNKVKEYLFVGY